MPAVISWSQAMYYYTELRASFLISSHKHQQYSLCLPMKG